MFSLDPFPLNILKLDENQTRHCQRGPNDTHKKLFFCHNEMSNAVHYNHDLKLCCQKSHIKANITDGSGRGARNLTGENIKVVWAEFSALS